VEPDTWESSLRNLKMFKGKLKRRFPTAGYLYNHSRTYVTATSLALLSTNDRCHEHSDILINR
jgi:hypothetical protein